MVRTVEGSTVIWMVVVIVAMVPMVIGTTVMGEARVLILACSNLIQFSHRRKNPREGEVGPQCVSSWKSVWILNGSLLENWGYNWFSGSAKTLLILYSYEGQVRSEMQYLQAIRGSCPLSLPHHQSSTLTQHDRIRLWVLLLPDISLAEPCSRLGEEHSEDSQAFWKA